VGRRRRLRRACGEAGRRVRGTLRQGVRRQRDRFGCRSSMSWELSDRRPLSSLEFAAMRQTPGWIWSPSSSSLRLAAMRQTPGWIWSPSSSSLRLAAMRQTPRRSWGPSSVSLRVPQCDSLRSQSGAAAECLELGPSAASRPCIRGVSAALLGRTCSRTTGIWIEGPPTGSGAQCAASAETGDGGCGATSR